MKNCPDCGAVSVVLETRSTVFGGRPAARRRRSCSARCGWKMKTLEIEAPEGTNCDLVLVDASKLRALTEAVAALHAGAISTNETETM